MKKTKRSLSKACDVILDKKGEGLTVLDVSQVSSFTDFFLICSGTNRKQNQAISDALTERLKKDLKLRPVHVEGYQNAEWILLDYIDFVVHILSTQARQFYKLEKLWSDGVQVEPQALTA